MAFAFLVGAAAVGACALDSTIDAPPSEPCSEAKDCSNDGNACTLTKCEGGICKYPALPEGAVPPQIAGDCEIVECDGSTVVVADDPNDVDDGSDCTTDECTNGVPSHPASPSGSPCFLGNSHGECDGAGECIVECSAEMPCPIDPAKPCADPVCDKQNRCKYVPRTGEPLVPMRTPGDCLASWCDAGVLGTIADDSDLPGDDGLECTEEKCVGGVAKHAPVMTGTACDGGTSYCDAAGQCKGCLIDAHCGVAAPCSTPTCDVAAGSCSDVPKSSGTPCTGGVCDGAGTCVPCVLATDCPMPANVCLARTCMMNACGTTPAASGTTCGTPPDDACDGAGTCVDCVDGGDCAELTPGPCQTAQCDVAHTCVLMPKMVGTLCPSGVCDATGACVECLTALECSAPTPMCCPNHKCAATCP